MDDIAEELFAGDMVLLEEDDLGEVLLDLICSQSGRDLEAEDPPREEEKTILEEDDPALEEDKITLEEDDPALEEDDFFPWEDDFFTREEDFFPWEEVFFTWEDFLTVWTKTPGAPPSAWDRSEGGATLRPPGATFFLIEKSFASFEERLKVSGPILPDPLAINFAIRAANSLPLSASTFIL